MTKTKITLMILLFFCTLCFIGCVANQTSPAQKITSVEGKTFILKEDRKFYWNGKVKYVAKKGDTVTIIASQTCLGTLNDECWTVNHPKHGKGVMGARHYLIKSN